MTTSISVANPPIKLIWPRGLPIVMYISSTSTHSNKIVKVKDVTGYMAMH